MTKTTALILFAVYVVVPAVIVLVGCTKAEAGPDMYEVSIYVDSQTGCQYVSAGGRGITPRMNSSHVQVGCKE